MQLEMKEHLGAYQDWESIQFDQDLKPHQAIRYQPLWMTFKKPSSNAQKKQAFEALLEVSKNGDDIPTEGLPNPVKANAEGRRPKGFFVDEIEKTIWKILLEKQKDSDTSQAPEMLFLIYVERSLLDVKSRGFTENSGLKGLNKFLHFVHLGPPVSVPNPDSTLSLLNITGITTRSDDKPIGAIIDDGIGYLNNRFYRPSGDSRFSKLWLQNNPRPRGELPNSYLAGKVIADFPTRKSNEEFDEKSLYRRLRSDPADHCTNGAISTDLASSHGTHVADTAYGQDPGTPLCKASALMTGVDLLAVELPKSSVLETHGKYLDTHILQGARWLVVQAIGLSSALASWRPLVLNISYGSHAGNKDGTDFLTLYINQILATYAYLAGLKGKDAREFARATFAYGNHGADAITASLKASKESHFKAKLNYLEWRLQPDDFSSSYLELRSHSPIFPDFEFHYAHGNITIKGLQPGQSRKVSVNGGIVLAIYAETCPGNTSKIIIALAPTRTHHYGHSVFPAGACTLKLLNGEASAQIARDDTPDGFSPHGRQSYMEHPSNLDFDAELNRYGKRAPPLMDSGNQSAWTDALDNHTESVGASMDGAAKQIQPWRLSSKGSTEALLGANPQPDSSAIGSQSQVFKGVRASGTISGSNARLAGSSMATAQRSKAIIFSFLSKDPAARVPRTRPRCDFSHRSSLGDYHTVRGFAPDGFYRD